MMESARKRQRWKAERESDGERKESDNAKMLIGAIYCSLLLLPLLLLLLRCMLCCAMLTFIIYKYTQHNIYLLVSILEMHHSFCLPSVRSDGVHTVHWEPYRTGLKCTHAAIFNTGTHTRMRADEITNTVNEEPITQYKFLYFLDPPAAGCWLLTLISLIYCSSWPLVERKYLPLK